MSKFRVRQHYGPETIGINAVADPSDEEGNWLNVDEYSTITYYFKGSATGDVVFEIQTQSPISKSEGLYKVADGSANDGTVTYNDFVGTVTISAANAAEPVPFDVRDYYALRINVVSYTGTLSVEATVGAGG